MPTTMSRIQDERIAGGFAVLLAIAGMAIANFNVDEGENGGALEFAVTAAVLLLVSALVFGRLLPGTAAPGKVAMWLAVAAVLTIAVFWSGLPVVLGVAAMVAGARAQSTGGTIAAVAGAVVAAGGVAALILG